VLKKANRLKSQGDFKRTLAGRRLCINDCFVIYGLAAPQSASGPFSARTMQPRIGFIVSKKIHKKSVYRNRIKRRLRELVRLYFLHTRTEDNRFAKYRTVVFIARNGSLQASFQTLRQKMERCLQQM
jgi:ribonuclease P protein component